MTTGPGKGLPPLPPVVDIVLVVVVVLVVGSLAHVVVVGSVGVAIVGRVEAVSEVVEMLRVGIHQSLQRPRVHWRHHLNITVEWSGKIEISSYLVLDGVRGLYVFLEVTVVIESHPTLVTHYIFGF